MASSLATYLARSATACAAILSAGRKSGVALRRSTEQRDTARIPDATIRCGKQSRVLFEVVSPSELQHKRQWDQKRTGLQAVEGAQEIVEIF